MGGVCQCEGYAGVEYTRGKRLHCVECAIVRSEQCEKYAGVRSKEFSNMGTMQYVEYAV